MESEPPTGTVRTVFEQTLRDVGWVNGQNVLIEFRFAEGRPGRLPALADELLALKVDVIYAADPYAIRALATATRTVPIVGYDLETDPVEAGWVVLAMRSTLTDFDETQPLEQRDDFAWFEDWKRTRHYAT